MTACKVTALLAAVALLGTAGVSGAASPRDSYVRHHISFEQEGVLEPGNEEGLSVNFVTPASWVPLRQTRRTHISFRVGTTNCRYSVTVTTRLTADTDETPLEHVTAALPAPGAGYVLDQGARNSAAAWRVTRLKRAAGATVTGVGLRAVRADRRSLGAGRKAWQETIVSAASRAQDECHSGTYRKVLGPQIGDALATMTGRAYSFTPRR